MQVTLRDAMPDDEAFLSALYTSNRLGEFVMHGWDVAQVEGLLQMQFSAQRRAYTLQYPEASHFIVLLDGQPVGQMWIDGVSPLNPSPHPANRPTSPVHLIDISLLPANQNQGIGTQLIRELQCAAGMQGRSVTLHAQTASPAVRLYQSLEFQLAGQDEMYCKMIWTPEKT